MSESRKKIILTFVLGKLNPFAAPDWYLKIDHNNDALVEQLQMKSFAHILWRSTGHVEKMGLLTDIYFRANQENACAIINGERNGWFVQRSGGNCNRLVAEFTVKQVEVEVPRFGSLMDDPTECLLKAWPIAETDPQALIDSCSYSQWPNGTHWYARLSNGIDVEWEGKRKWDTRAEAEAVVPAFVASLITEKS